MALPVQSIRARPEHRDLLRRVAEMLRRDGEFTLRRFLEQPQTRPVGPFRDEAAALAFLRDRLVIALKPRSIWLFGSRARSSARADSDFDLLLVLPDGLSSDIYADYQRAAEPVVGCGLGYDIVPCSWSDFQKSRSEPGSLANKVVIEGKEIYRDRSQRTKEMQA